MIFFSMQHIATPPKMALSYNEHMSFFTSSIIINLLFFSFCKFSVNLQFTASRLIYFLDTFSSEANMVKLCHLVLVHNCIAVETVRLCSQNCCKWEGEVLHSLASMQMNLVFHIHKKKPLPLKKKNPVIDSPAYQDAQPHPD